MTINYKSQSMDCCLKYFSWFFFMLTIIVEFLFLYASRSYWIRWYIESIWRVVGVNCGFDGLFFSGRNLKCIYFVIYLYVFKLLCTRWENFIRIGITVLYLKSCRCQLWIWRSQISVLLAPLHVASKTAFATVKSTIETSNSSNAVLLFLN